MIIAEINFPKTYQNNKLKQDTYLHNVRSQSIKALKLYYNGNNRDIKDIRTRLSLLQTYINIIYNININIYTILQFIFANLKYDLDRKYIILDDQLKLKGVKILTLIKLIKFGTTQIKGSDIMDRCLKYAFNSIYVNNMLINFRF